MPVQVPWDRARQNKSVSYPGAVAGMFVLATSQEHDIAENSCRANGEEIANSKYLSEGSWDENEEWGWESTDGLEMFAQSWEPEEPPKAIGCLVHGLGEHSGRYAHVGKAFADAGFALASFDLRGHGKSGGPRGISHLLMLSWMISRLFRNN